MAKWQHIINLIIGIWLIVASFLNFGGAAYLWNFLISGLLVGIFSIWEMAE